MRTAFWQDVCESANRHGNAVFETVPADEIDTCSGSRLIGMMSGND
jgi:hypothetical protein